MTTVEHWLATCRSELNYEEYPRGSNRTKFAAEAGHANGYAWCVTYLVAMAKRSGLHLPYYGAGAQQMADAFKHIGRYGTTPRVGAIGFKYHPELGRIAHAFTVESLLADHYTSGINGNSNTDGSREGYKVCRVKRSPYRITYGYPVFTAPITTTLHANPYAVPVLGSRLYISRDSKKTTSEVKYIQWAAGGPAYDDGVWGDTTEKIVRHFQDIKGLYVDGRVGTKTLTVMKAVRR